MNWHSGLSKGRDFTLLHSSQVRSGAYPAFYLGRYLVYSDQGVKLTTHLHQVPKLRLCRGIAPFSHLELYLNMHINDFMSCHFTFS